MRSEGENRTVFHTVRLTESEAEEVVAHAEASGLSISALIRYRLLGRPLPMGSAPAINLVAWRDLAPLTSNLNQMTVHANHQRLTDSISILDLVQVKSLLAKLSDQVQKIRILLIGAN